MNEMDRILIVDDDENTVNSLRLILGTKGYVVDAASTGKEAIEKVSNTICNLVLMDLKLPDMEGIDLLASLRAINPGVLVIVITGFPSLETSIRALNEGANAYLTKPLNMNNALTKINEVLNQQSRLAELEEKSRHIHVEISESLRVVTCIREILLRDGINSAISNVNMTLIAQLDETDKILENVRKYKPNIVILDFSVLAKEGESIIRSMRKELPTISVLALCEQEKLVGNLPAAIKAGAAACLPYNTNAKQLVMAVIGIHYGQMVTTLDAAQHLLRDTRSQSSGVEIPCTLNERELQVVELIAKGLHNREIANTLNISIRTVDTHVRSILSKTSASSRTEAISKAFKNKWINTF
jgi:DNA-binding NarL/FixJ family response regulator